MDVEPVELVETPYEHPDAADLRAAQRVEIAERYGRDDAESGPAPTAADIEVFLVAYVAGEPVGCGGLRRLHESCAEIKRMYVRPTHRGTGVARAVLIGLQDAAAVRAISVLRLETGDAQPDAIRFYEREGYRPIPAFGPYVGSAISRCYERTL